MTKAILEPRTRLTLERHGAIEPPACPSAERLTAEIEKRGGELLLVAGQRDAAGRALPATATILMENQEFSASDPHAQVAIATCLAEALTGIWGPNGTQGVPQGAPRSADRG